MKFDQLAQSGTIDVPLCRSGVPLIILDRNNFAADRQRTRHPNGAVRPERSDLQNARGSDHPGKERQHFPLRGRHIVGRQVVVCIVGQCRS